MDSIGIPWLHHRKKTLLLSISLIFQSRQFMPIPSQTNDDTSKVFFSFFFFDFVIDEACRDGLTSFRAQLQKVFAFLSVGEPASS